MQHAALTFFDTLGKLHFPFAGQKRCQPHLAQVEANRIAGSAVVGFFFFGGRRGLRVGLFLRLYLNGGRMVGYLGGKTSIHNSDVFATQRRQPIVDRIGGMDALRHVVSHIVVREEPLGVVDGGEIMLLTLACLARRCSFSSGFVDDFDFFVVLIVVAELLVTIFDHVVKTSYVEAEGPPSCERIWST